DGFARATGRLAAVVTSTGVGAGNAAGSLLEAYSASAPVIHVTGQVEAAFVDGDRGFLHGVKDQLTMLDSVGKGGVSRRADRGHTCHDAGRYEPRVAGPVSVEIPIDQQYRAVDASTD